MTDRSAMYRLLSLSMQWPDRRFISNVHQALSEMQSATNQLNMLKAFKNALDELADLPLERVQAIYTELFINGFPHTPCPPYESVYRDGGGLLGPASDQVNAFYTNWGLNSGKQLPDHLTVELEFIHLLLEAIVVADGDDADHFQRLAQRFWHKHLNQWASSFASDLRANANHIFYQSLGMLLSEFLEQEHARWAKYADRSLDLHQTVRPVGSTTNVSINSKITSNGRRS